MWHILGFFFKIHLIKLGVCSFDHGSDVNRIYKECFFFFLNKYNFGYHLGLPSPKMASLPWCLSQTAMFPLVRPPRWARMILTVWTGCTSAVSIREICCWTRHVYIHILSLTLILPPVLSLSETDKKYTEITFCPQFRASAGFFTKSTAEWQCW